MYQDRYELTVDKLLLSIRNNPNQIVAYKDEKHITYREFKERVYDLARGLVQIGLKKGDRVAVLDYDTLNYATEYFSVPIAGGVIHTVNIRYSPELIFYSMKHASDRFVIISDEFIPIIEKSVQLFDFVEKWIVTHVGDKPSAMLPGAIDIDDLFVKDSNIQLPELKEDDVATTFYTSGTTGFPKGVIFSHRQVVLHSVAGQLGLGNEPLKSSSTDVLMPLVPMFHVHSWGIPYGVFLLGAKYVLPGKYDFEKIPAIMEKEEVTISYMVPSILYLLLTSKDGPGVFQRLKPKVVIGGGALSKGLADRANSLGITILAGYGMSETAPVLTMGILTHETRHLEEGKRRELQNKAGVPFPLVDLKVVDSGFKEVPWDSRSIGEIVVRTPWNTREYIHDEEATKKLWKNDWLNTGDLATVDEYGYVGIVDRERDAVKSGGEFIPTIILEDAISTFHGVGEVAVVGMKDEKWGERPVAFMTGLEKVDDAAIRDHLQGYIDTGRIAKFWIPDKFVAIKEFKKTSTGKIDKKPLRENLDELLRGT